ncbi:hypothetical protein Tco_0044718 [Tanacetum coccineum]
MLQRHKTGILARECERRTRIEERWMELGIEKGEELEIEMKAYWKERKKSRALVTVDGEYSQAHDRDQGIYLADYQYINGGPVAFGGCRGLYYRDRPLGQIAGIVALRGFLVGYSLQSKAFRVYNLNQVTFMQVKKETNQNEGSKDKIVAGDSDKEDESAQDCFEVPYWHSYSSTNTSSSKSDEKRRSPREEEQVFLDDLARLQRQEKEANEEAEALTKNLEQDTEKASGTNIISTVSTTAKASGTNFVNTVSIPVGTASANEGLSLSNTTNSQEDDYEIPPLEDIHEDATDGIFTHSSYDDEGAVADFTNLETIVNVSPIPTSRVQSLASLTLFLRRFLSSAVKTEGKVNKSSEAYAFVSLCSKAKFQKLFEEKAGVDAMQEELLQFEFQKVWDSSRFALWKKAFGTSGCDRNRKMNEEWLSETKLFSCSGNKQGKE